MYWKETIVRQNETGVGLGEFLGENEFFFIRGSVPSDPDPLAV